MTEKNEETMIRISKNTRDRVKAMAKEKHCTTSTLLCRIIDKYCENPIFFDGLDAGELKSLRATVSGLLIRIDRVAGMTERTEAFIKTLLSQDRPAVPGIADDSAGSTVSTSGYDDSMVSALSALLGRLLDRATRTKNFDGTQAMQIRISMDEFARIQNQYEQACTLRNS